MSNQDNANPQPHVNKPDSFYRGKAANQRNPAAIHKPFNTRKNPPKPRNPATNQASLPTGLPAPTQKVHNSGGEVTSTNPADGSLFAFGLSIRENTLRQTFSPSAPALIEISVQTFAELVTDDSTLGKQLLPEYLSYYSTAMLWLRIITLKEKNSQPLTIAEQDLLSMCKALTFNLPEPILLQVRALGNVVSSTKQHLYPEFPPMPAEIIQQQGGYYGTLVNPGPNVDNSRHNLYEEIPCLGVTAFAVRQALSNMQPGQYASTIVFNGHQPTRNLLGFRPVGYRRPEAKNLAFDHGITDAAFRSYPNALAFNLEFLIAISNILANTKTFKITPVVFGTLTEIGALSQTIIERPILTEEDETPAVLGDLLPTSLSKDKDEVFGSGLFFCQQLMKLRVGQNDQSWSLFQVIPQEWIDNRNERRNLPPEYLMERFSSVSQRGTGFRVNIIKTMVLTKR